MKRYTGHFTHHFRPISLGCALLLSACGGGGGETDLGISPANANACTVADIQAVVNGLTGNLRTSISAATRVPAGQTANGSAVTATNPALPEHCNVTGTIDEHTGEPANTVYGNKFRLRLPANWNGRFFFTGGGGNDGFVPDAVGSLSSGTPGDSALKRGFAVVGQDSGHAGSNPGFALDEKAYINFAHQSVHDASVVSKTVLTGYYGRSPKRSYFVGCSNGGREAMVSAQRYDDFDGIVAGAPALNMFDQWTQDVWNMRIMSQLVGTPAGTVPTATSAAFTDGQLGYISSYFTSKCDALDGLADGLVSNYQKCSATAEDLAKLTCSANGGTSADGNCLSPAQSAGLGKIYSGPVNSAGTQIYPGFYPGGVETAWRAGMIGTGTTGLGSFYNSVIPNMPFMGYGFRGYPGVTGDPRLPSSYPSGAEYGARFNFDADPMMMEPGRLLFHADNLDPGRPGPNYQNFVQRGGKLLIYSGVADASVQATGVTDFMDKVQRRYTPIGADTFVRAFLVPGMNHCGGGKTTDQFDVLTSLVDWVEKGTAPDRIVAKAAPGNALDPSSAGVTRPLCAYPRYARYNGTGDRNSAASFACASN